MKKKQLLLMAAAFALVLCTSLATTLSYFTTYAMAKGGYPIHLGHETEIVETVSAMTKHITISNKAGSVPVYVRAQAFAGEDFQLTFSGEGWSKGSDGYYYYNGSLAGGESTQELLVKIKVPEDREFAAGETFNVIVVYETTPVLFDDEGKPYADWTREVISKKDVVEGAVKYE